MARSAPRSRVALAVLMALWLAPWGGLAVAAEAPPQMSGRDFLSRSQAERDHYVDGLVDQLMFLHRSKLAEGFAWFEACLAAGGRPALAEALARAIEAHPGRLAEPAVRNFLWAAAELCTTP